MTEVFTWVDVFVWVVALGTLFAGIVGVGNIMLIAVAERTRRSGCGRRSAPPRLPSSA
jgi:putative ABC transport system permease protein